MRIIVAKVITALLLTIGATHCVFAQPALVSEEVLAALKQSSTDQPAVPVVVNFALSKSKNRLDKNDIQQIGEAILADLATLNHGRSANQAYQLVAQFSEIPALSLKVSPDALNLLAGRSDIASVNLDHTIKLSMTEALPISGAATVHSSGYTGNGVIAAVIDTGIDTDHPNLVDDLVHQHCFRTENDCIGGATSAEDQNGHGTHVSGIITGAKGVAPDAQIVALKVFTTHTTTDTNILNALNYIITNQATLNIDMINMSLGGNNYSNQSSCDAANMAYVNAFSTLNALGISIFVSTGNDAGTNGVGAPGCVSGAIGVGSSGDATFNYNFTVCTDNGALDKVSCYSNTTPVQGDGELVDLIAPGCDITSEWPGGGTDTICGTSMATPYTLGVGALIKQYLNDHSLSMTPTQLEEHLELTGVPISDYRLAAGSPTFPRVSAVNALGALELAIPTGFQITATTSNSVTMQWSTAAGATAYHLYRSVDNGVTYTQIGSVNAPITTFIDNSPPCDNLLYYVKTFNGSFESLPSNTDTTTARTCPIAPTNLTVTATSSSSANLSWTDNASDETGYVIERKTGAFGAYTVVHDLAANTTTVAETSLACGLYTYRAYVKRGTDISAYSNEVEFSACAPDHDLVISPRVISTATYADTVNSAQMATVSASDPQHSCAIGSARTGTHTMWYRFTPTVNGKISLNTEGSSGSYSDTLLSVFTGNSGSFASYACDDDAGTGVLSNIGSATVTADTNYTIFVSRWDHTATTAVGTLKLNFSFVADPGVTIPSSALSISEGGVTGSYNVVLNKQPTADVTISVTPDTQCTTSASSLTFTSGNWNVAQSVTVTAVDDAVVEGSHSCSVTHGVSSADSAYNGISANSVTANIADNDTAAVTVTPTSLSLTEGGATGGYSVVLGSQPTADVTISVTPDTQCTTSASSLTFTSGNWNVAQSVTVTAVDDAVVEGSHSCSVTHGVSSADSAYNGISANSVTANIADNDNSGIPTLSQWALALLTMLLGGLLYRRAEHN